MRGAPSRARPRAEARCRNPSAALPARIRGRSRPLSARGRKYAVVSALEIRVPLYPPEFEGAHDRILPSPGAKRDEGIVHGDAPEVEGIGAPGGVGVQEDVAVLLWVHVTDGDCLKARLN